MCIYNSKIVYRSLTRQNQMCELGWFRLDGYIIKPAFYTFAVADLGGARGAVPPTWYLRTYKEMAVLL